jgi:hypothetical protein
MLSIITLRQDHGPAEPSSLVTAAQVLVAVYNRAFLLSQSLMPAFSALCLGSALYRFRLVPRVIALLGLLGAPLLLASDAAILWGSYGPQSPFAVLAALPVALWELALGLWLLVRGFQPAPLDSAPDVGRSAGSPDSGALPSAVH